MIAAGLAAVVPWAVATTPCSCKQDCLILMTTGSSYGNKVICKLRNIQCACWLRLTPRSQPLSEMACSQWAHHLGGMPRCYDSMQLYRRLPQTCCAISCTVRTSLHAQHSLELL